jgi:RNA polymerase sigma-70 factor (ECF subfamily)
MGKALDVRIPWRISIMAGNGRLEVRLPCCSSVARTLPNSSLLETLMNADVSEDGTSSSLLASVRSGDAEAWIKLARWIGPLILKWCRRAGLQPADGDEVAQQVFTNIWRRLDTFRKGAPGDSFRGWVYVITRNCIRDLRAKRRDGPGPLPPEVSVGADSADAGDLQRRALQLLVQDAIARYVNDRGFKAFYRTAVDGLSAVEAGIELNLSPDLVRQHKSRWLKRLRDRLRHEFGDLLD